MLDANRNVRTAEQPATLFRVMQEAIGQELRQHYQPPAPPISHEMLVLLMQINEDKRLKRPILCR